MRINFSYIELKAVILAGGLGKRLRPLTDDKPKTMIQISGTPIIGWQLKWLTRHNIRGVIVSLGHLKEAVIDYVGSGESFGVAVQYSEEETPLGTGGALKATQHILNEKEKSLFLMLYGDIMTDLDPSLLIQKLETNRSNALCSLAAISLRSPFGII